MLIGVVQGRSPESHLSPGNSVLIKHPPSSLECFVFFWQKAFSVGKLVLQFVLHGFMAHVQNLPETPQIINKLIMS